MSLITTHLVVPPNELEKIVEANLEVHQALSQRYALLKEVFTAGRYVYWKSRAFPQSGISIRVVGDKHFPRVHCENSRTRKRVDVDVNLIDWERMARVSIQSAMIIQSQGAEEQGKEDVKK